MVKREIQAIAYLVIILVIPGIFTGVVIAAEADESDRLEGGRKMYEKGMLPSGQSMVATIQGDIVVKGQQVVCGTCHRRSGMGSSEGQQVVPAVTGDLLFKPLQLPTQQPPAPPVLRPAYTRESLKRAITQGIDANGEPLDPFMPRYGLDDQSLETLIDYLDSLSEKISPGVTDDEIHFATIINDGLRDEQKQALLKVLTAFIEQKNVETRNESNRALHAPWHKAWQFKPYRKWVLHLWELQGPESTWTGQLDSLYKDRAVFAILSGSVDGDWKPVHEFCETNRVPCLFPTTDLPVVSEKDFYTLYLNRGMTLDGEGVAKHIRQDSVTQKEVIQYYLQGDKRAKTAADQVRKRLVEDGFKVTDYMLPDVDKGVTKHPPSTNDIAICVWGGKDVLKRVLDAMPNDIDAPRIYLSTTLFGTDTSAIPEQLIDSVYLIHTAELPIRLNRLLARSTGWFKSKRIYDPAAKRIQANAYFALKVAGDALKHIRGYFYRDYFIERIEHLIDNAPYTSVYPRIGLAPGQRFVSKGYYITQPSQDMRRGIQGVTDWIIP